MRALALAATAVALLPAAASAERRALVQVSQGGNAELDAAYGGMTPDGDHLFSTTPEALTSDDTDTLVDVYERKGGTTRLVSGTDDPAAAGFVAATPSASHVVLASSQPLTPDDDDNASDLFVRSASGTELATFPEGDVLLRTSHAFSDISDDGTHVFFVSGERLSADDRDDQFDLFDRTGGHTVKLTPGNGPYGVGIGAPSTASPSGDRITFVTREALVPEDTDDKADIYVRAGAALTLVTSVQTATPQDMVLRQVSTDGRHVFFQTTEPLDPADTDDRSDAYHWSAAEGLRYDTPGTAETVDFQRGSDDGSRVWFSTYDRLTPQDTDDNSDLYLRTGGTTTLDTPGNAGPDDQVFCGISPDGARMWLYTHERMTADDTDFAIDVFERRAGVTTRVSRGAINDQAPYDASCAGQAPDGARVIFQTDGPMTSADADTTDDLYEHDAGGTTLLTGGTANVPALWQGASADARRVLFTTREPLVAGDTDQAIDVYAATSEPDPPPPAETRAPIADGAVVPAADAPRTLPVPAAARVAGRTVKLRLTRRAGGRCWAYSPTRSRFIGVRCERAFFFRAPPGGLRLPRRLEPGRYVLTTKIDGAAHALAFSIRG